MPGKKANVKIKLPVLITLIIVISLVSSTLVFVIGSNGINTDNSSTKGNPSTGSSELYLTVAPDIFSGNLSTKDIGNGKNITFDVPGTTFNFTINQTFNMTASVINHQGKAMNYSIIVYQMVNDTENNLTNFTSLYVGRLDTMVDRSIGWCDIRVQVPLAAGNDTTLGVLLTDADEASVATVLNETEFTANVF